MVDVWRHVFVAVFEVEAMASDARLRFYDRSLPVLDDVTARVRVDVILCARTCYTDGVVE